MESIIYGLTIGLFLSVDAFLMSILYGTTYKKRSQTIETSLIVGIFHFIMPLIGYLIASFTLSSINLDTEFIAAIIFFFLGFQLYTNKPDDHQNYKLSNIIGKILFAFSVSIDSFLVGVSFEFLDIDIYISATLFALVSASITFLGLSLGKTTTEKFSKFPIAKIAGIGMIVISLLTLVKIFFT